jgi:predicted glycosyl hydrolase (DUF1957 family)
MATSCKPQTPEQIADEQLQDEITAFIEKTHRTIQKARRRMTRAEREKADKNANAILDQASAAARAPRRRA